MDTHDSAATEQQLDLEFAIEYPYFSMPLNQTNRHQKMEVGNPLEILENNQSYEI